MNTCTLMNAENNMEMEGNTDILSV